VPDPDPFDPIAEAHRQWSARWPEHADHMAAVTSVMRVQQLLLARIEAALQPYGLTFAAYEALRLLAFTRSGSMPMGKMGERLMVHPASVTNAIRRLEQRGLVERHTSAQDRRVVLATITDAGRAVARDATAALNRADFGLQALSGDETAQLTSMLRHVRVAVGDIADVPVGSSLFSAERSVVRASALLRRDAERFGMGAAVVLGQDLTEVARPVGHRAVADLAAGDRQLGDGHGEAARR
jgi:DNA-binding MarR family transcriptional regulator